MPLRRVGGDDDGRCWRANGDIRAVERDVLPLGDAAAAAPELKNSSGGVSTAWTVSKLRVKLCTSSCDTAESRPRGLGDNPKADWARSTSLRRALNSNRCCKVSAAPGAAGALALARGDLGTTLALAPAPAPTTRRGFATD